MILPLFSELKVKSRGMEGDPELNSHSLFPVLALKLIFVYGVGAI
jgi:hypothetical protein